MKLVMLFIKRSTLLSAPVFSNVVIASVAVLRFGSALRIKKRTGEFSRFVFAIHENEVTSAHSRCVTQSR